MNLSSIGVIPHSFAKGGRERDLTMGPRQQERKVE